MGRSVLILGAKLVVTWVPIVVILVALGVIFGWRLAVAVIAGFALFLVRAHTEPRDPGRLRAVVEFVIFAVIGTALGAFANGALGGIFGCLVGISARLAEVPISGLHPWSKGRSKSER
jgi:hypothetical protein